MLDVVGPQGLSVIANTGDDIEIYGAYVSPDPDLVSFWLADLIDERGWGLAGDTFFVMDALRAIGSDVWFNLGDRDLAWCIERSRMNSEGLSPTAAHERLAASIGLRARVLPMSEDPVRTWVRTPAGWRSFQEFMIRDRAAGPVEGLEFRGAEQARASEQALQAIAQAGAIVIGPSNPLASIAPILAVPGMREALAAAAAPVVAVSPIVGGEVLKGPTEAFMAFAGARLQRARRGRLLRRSARRDRGRRGRRAARAGAADEHADGRRGGSRAARARDARVRAGARRVASQPACNHPAAPPLAVV